LSFNKRNNYLLAIYCLVTDEKELCYYQIASPWVIIKTAVLAIFTVAFFLISDRVTPDAAAYQFWAQ